MLAREKAVNKILEFGLSKVILVDVVVAILAFIYCGFDYAAINDDYIFKFFMSSIFSPLYIIFLGKLHTITGADKKYMKDIKTRHSCFTAIGIPCFLLGVYCLVLLLIRSEFEATLVIFMGNNVLYASCVTTRIILNNAEKEKEKEEV